MSATSGPYRIVRNASYRPSELATARTYSTLEGAVGDMGEGLVVAGDGQIAAFHERHLPFLTATAATETPDSSGVGH